jgi:hypothetical protein
MYNTNVIQRRFYIYQIFISIIYLNVCKICLVTWLCFLSMGLFCNPSKRKPQRRVSMNVSKSRYWVNYYCVHKSIVVHCQIKKILYGSVFWCVVEIAWVIWNHEWWLASFGSCQHFFKLLRGKVLKCVSNSVTSFILRPRIRLGPGWSRKF